MKFSYANIYFRKKIFILIVTLKKRLANSLRKPILKKGHTRFDPPIRPFEGRIITKQANFFFSKSLLFYYESTFQRSKRDKIIIDNNY